MTTYNKYTFFYGGPFSQWSHSKFTIDGKEFNTAEQYMMYKKALVFGDDQSAAAIMGTKDPSKQKAIGREIKGFSIPIWASVSRDVVYRGNVAKFAQNHEHYLALMQTKGTLLVEASPTDTIWGIGLSEYDAMGSTPEQWKGSNWLGQVITEVREAFEYHDSYGVFITL